MNLFPNNSNNRDTISSEKLFDSIINIKYIQSLKTMQFHLVQ